MSDKKSKGELLQEELTMKAEHSEIRMEEKEIKEAYKLAESYKTFLDNAKTERESVDEAIKMLDKAGFVEFDASKKYEQGDKVYLNNRNKSLLFATIGKKPIEDGVRIIASHIDAPRIDLKPTPLYEDSSLALFKTHYYGGIRKYQWVTIPLALHGVVVKKDGTTVPIVIGEDESDPVFYITDLLPHLSQEQNTRPLHDGIKGEELNVLVGSVPYDDDKVSEKVKLNVLRILNEKYDIKEDDFFSADLSLVPASKARDVGFDRSMIASYGHDDRVSAYPSLVACIEVDNPEYTWVNILADREEIGSDGNTGLNSRMLEYFVADLAKPYGVEVRTVLGNSTCLSADVTVAFDPTFPEVSDKRNNARLGFGTALCKYTGSRGKSGTSEAHAEFLGWLRKTFDDKDVIWQSGTLGRVDLGGGGTVAKYVANLGIDVVDIGVPVLAMHAPVEVVSKADVYSTYKAFEAYLSAK